MGWRGEVDLVVEEVLAGRVLAVRRSVVGIGWARHCEQNVSRCSNDKSFSMKTRCRCLRCNRHVAKFGDLHKLANGPNIGAVSGTVQVSCGRSSPQRTALDVTESLSEVRREDGDLSTVLGVVVELVDQSYDSRLVVAGKVGNLGNVGGTAALDEGNELRRQDREENEVAGTSIVDLQFPLATDAAIRLP